MSRLRKYPGDSEEPSGDPFLDPEGHNRFADRDEGPIPAGAAETTGPYASATGGMPAHRVGGYATTLPHRGGTVLSLGLFGLFGAAGAAFCFPLLMVNLLLTLPAWLMGQSDLRAIQAGAMDPAGRGMTLAGYVMGILGTIATLILFVVMGWITFKMGSVW